MAVGSHDQRTRTPNVTQRQTRVQADAHHSIIYASDFDRSPTEILVGQQDTTRQRPSAGLTPQVLHIPTLFTTAERQRIAAVDGQLRAHGSSNDCPGQPCCQVAGVAFCTPVDQVTDLGTNRRDTTVDAIAEDDSVVGKIQGEHPVGGPRFEQISPARPLDHAAGLGDFDCDLRLISEAGEIHLEGLVRIPLTRTDHSHRARFELDDGQDVDSDAQHSGRDREEVLQSSHSQSGPHPGQATGDRGYPHLHGPGTTEQLGRIRHDLDPLPGGPIAFDPVVDDQASSQCFGNQPEVRGPIEFETQDDGVLDGRGPGLDQGAVKHDLEHIGGRRADTSAASVHPKRDTGSADQALLDDPCRRDVHILSQLECDLWLFDAVHARTTVEVDSNRTRLTSNRVRARPQ